MAEPWYKDGLLFECQRCGICCTGDPGVVWINREEIAALAEHLHMSQAEFVARYTRETVSRRSLIELPNGDCVFYSRQQGCEIYPLRPRQCRTWPFWPSNLASPDAWREVCQTCPGANRGRLYTFDEIRARAGSVRV